MRWNPYLNFNGNCPAAFKYYEQALGGKIEAMMTFGQTPAAEHVPAEYHDRVMHVRLAVGDQLLMGSDDTPQHPHPGIKGCSVALHVNSPAEAERVFQALVKGGSVTMPLQQTFWAARFGMLIDQFGVPWMFNCEPAA